MGADDASKKRKRNSSEAGGSNLPQYPMGSVVAVRTDEEPYPHLAVLKQAAPKIVANDEEDEDALEAEGIDILWLYRSLDIKKQPKDLLCSPCSVSRSTGGGSSRTTDEGRLKEVFFSCHPSTIPAATILHEVKVRFLSKANLALAEELKHKPGFICRSLVDTTDWKCHPLNPKLPANPEDGSLLQLILNSTDQELRFLRRLPASK